ncbi:MAG: hypothetical protein NVS3B12_04050 [Acidimicrobiales bacterium]
MGLTERNPLIIGAVAIAVIVAGTLAALTIKADTFAPSYAISANFRDTAGLRPGDRVTTSGVLIGHVGAISQDGDSVRVKIKINHGVQVARSSKAAIRVETLLGRRAITLTAPKDADWRDLYHKGDHIPGTGGSPTEVLDVQADAQSALANLDANALNKFLADLTQVTSGKREQVTTIIDGLNRLTSTVNSRRDELGRLITSANAVSSTVESRNANLLSAIDNLNIVVANLDARRAELTQLLVSTQESASKITNLIGDNKAKLDAVLASLRTDLGVINRHQVDLAQTVSYLAGAVEGFSSVGYSGPKDTPNRWANIYTVGVGAASSDPIFGCHGELDSALTIAVGPDPVKSCAGYTGPVPGGPSSGAPKVAPAPGAGAGQPSALPGSVVTPSATTTAASLNSLLVPLLSGGSQ